MRNGGDEGVLQRYFVERHEKCSYEGQKILDARLNQPFDLYPGIFCLLEDERREGRATANPV